MQHIRTELESRLGIRSTYTGTFIKTGYKKRFAKYCKTSPAKTCLIVDIKDQTGKIIVTHQWFPFKEFSKLDLRFGDVVEFKATPSSYRKGGIYTPFTFDYMLAFPKHVKNLTKGGD